MTVIEAPVHGPSLTTEEIMDMVEKVARWGNNVLVVSLGLLSLAVLIVAR